LAVGLLGYSICARSSLPAAKTMMRVTILKGMRVMTLKRMTVKVLTVMSV
jgi:hypothetical protein